MWKWYVVLWFEALIFLIPPAAGAPSAVNGESNGQQMSQANPEGSTRLTGCDAKLQKPSYTFGAESPSDLTGARTGPATMSKRGEFFAVLSHAGRTGVYNFSKDKFVSYEEGMLENVSDLYESRSGRMYFGYVTPNEIKVIDARTGNPLLTKSLVDIPNVGDIVAQLGSDTPLYRPLFYENGAGVHVALVPRSEDLYLDEVFSVPLYLMNVRTGEGNLGHPHSGIIRYARMQDGRAYGIGWERELGGPANTLLVYDLIQQKALLREKFEHQQDPPIISGPLDLFFQAPRQPELVMHLQSPTGKVMIYDREARKFQPLPGLSRSKTMSIQFYNESDGKPWFAAIEGSGSVGLSPEYFSLVIQPMVDFNGAAVVDLELENPQNDISAVEVIERPEGRLFLAWERTVFEGKVRYARVHIYDQKLQKQFIAQIPYNWPGAIRKKSFWDSTRHAVVSYFTRDDGSTPEFAVLSPGERIVVHNPPMAPELD